MTVAQCWSFNIAGARCELGAGHDGVHAVAVEWTDAEAWQPTMVEMTKTAKPVPVIGFPDLPEGDADLAEPGACFSCGCSEAAHEGGGCRPHACRGYVP